MTYLGMAAIPLEDVEYSKRDEEDGDQHKGHVEGMPWVRAARPKIWKI